MFKNLTIYRIHEAEMSISSVEAAAEDRQFEETGPTQTSSSGWVPVRGEAGGALIESINGHWLMKHMLEVRSVPSGSLNRLLKKKIDAHYQEYGYRPGRKFAKELREEAMHELLPTAPIRQSAVFVWIDLGTDRVLIDSASQGRCDRLITLLVETIKGLTVGLLSTEEAPQAGMAYWLRDSEPPAGFSIDRHCELRAVDESKAVVRYVNHPLETEEVQDHIKQGKLPVSLAMTWDDRVSFVLTDSLRLKKIRMLETTVEAKNDADSFDADFTIATSELQPLLNDIIKDLGGTASGEISRKPRDETEDEDGVDADIEDDDDL